MKPLKLDADQLLDDVAEKPKPGKISQLLETMNSDERTALVAVMKDETIPARRISKALKNQGFDVGPHPIDTWRGQNDVPS